MQPLTPLIFEERIQAYTNGLHAVVPLQPEDKLLAMDFTAANEDLANALLKDTDAFGRYVNEKLAAADARYGVGGYNEDRVIYRRSELFGPSPQLVPMESDSVKAPSPREGSAKGRSVHLGLDIWGPAGTLVHAPLAGTVHSFAFNDAFGDYGATLILKHQLDDSVFHTLYGHLSLSSIQNKKEGQRITAGETIAWFGVPEENGHWPPHLHFQIVLDMQGMHGDYPGVCTQEDRATYLSNCPPPALLFPAAALPI